MLNKNPNKARIICQRSNKVKSFWIVIYSTILVLTEGFVIYGLFSVITGNATVINKLISILGISIIGVAGWIIVVALINESHGTVIKRESVMFLRSSIRNFVRPFLIDVPFDEISTDKIRSLSLSIRKGNRWNLNIDFQDDYSIDIWSFNGYPRECLHNLKNWATELNAKGVAVKIDFENKGAS